MTDSEKSADEPSGDGPDRPTTGRIRRALVPTVLLVLAAALVVTGVVLLLRAHHLSDTSTTDNRALVDRRASSEVVGQVSTGLTQVLSYDYRKPDTAAAAAKRWLTGDATSEYATLIAQLKKAAAGEDLVLRAKVTSAGVESLEGDTARLLVFVDQQSTRSSDQQSSLAAAQVQITAKRVGERWVISQLKAI